MTIIKVFYTAIAWFLLSFSLFAQDKEVLWADSVISFSYQVDSKIFSAYQVLGPPSVMPDFGESNSAWLMNSRHDRYDQHFVKVRFPKKIHVKQVAILENINPGAISAVFLYDSTGKQHRIYQNNSPQMIGEKGRMFNIFIDETPYLTNELRVDINTINYFDIYQIDAIGISSSGDSIKAKIDVIENIDEDYEKVNLGANINSPYGELAPQISLDGNELFFTRNDHPDNISPKDDQDIWIAVKDSAGNFKKAENPGPPLNNEHHNFALSITPDGNGLIVGNIYHRDGLPEPGVSISYREGNSWTFPRPLEINNYYNRSKKMSLTLTSSGKVLLLGINRLDTRGSHDIYVSFLRKDGSWSSPLNLGDDINTASSEDTPFLAADGKTLYFSSSGRPGYGLTDIFVSRRMDESWQKWSKPLNLGPRINSPQWDGYYTVSAEGETAYIVSSQNSKGAEDIFRIKLPQAVKPEAVVLIKGKVLDAKTNEPLRAEISYEELPEGKNVGVARSNPVTGEYTISLPSGKKYGFMAVADNYLSVNENINLTENVEYREIKRNLYLVPIEEGQKVRLNNIFFDTGEFELREDSYPELKRIAEFLKNNPDITIKIEGHTDKVGNDSYNMVLSKNRADAVEEYLISQGIDEGRIETEGYGETNPIATNDTAEGRQLNRRVEFLITGNK